MKLYNTLSKKVENFLPINKNEIKMYVCGITPYDTTHLGHAFTYMTFDVLQRYLQHLGYTVNYVQNVTDIDDDILKKSKEVDQDWQTLGTFWTNMFLKDIKALNIIKPTHYVKATDSIDTIIEIVSSLVEKQFAYEKNGNVYFDVGKVSDYGKLSHYSREEMIKLSKERGANPDDPLKKDPLDFILWQKSLPDEPFWNSPWGEGRPGWHIECSAMIYKYHYKYLDIHGGGTDLMYPHHESEIAQSEHFTGIKPFSKYWMHTGAVGYQGEKMSKSLGNLVLISDLLKSYSPNTIRYLLLSHHYRAAWGFKEDQLHIAKVKTEQLEKSLKIPPSQNDHSEESLNLFHTSMLNDLNTPKALIALEKSIIANDYKSIKIISKLLGFII